MRRALLMILMMLFVWAEALSDKRPRIIGQKTLQVEQGKSITLKLSDLIVTFDDDDNDDDDDDDDDDNGDYPEDYFIVIHRGNNYAFDEATVTPHADFTGTLTVDVRVSNGKRRSKKFPLKITVLPSEQNTPPVITGQRPVEVVEGSSVTIKFSDLSVSDPDDNYPDGFRLIVLAGANYGHNGEKITPAAGFSGDLSIGVKVNDGEDDSPVFPFKVTVKKESTPPSNVAPVITGQMQIGITENESITIQYTHLKVTDPDNNYPADFSLRVSEGSNYSLSGRTVTPDNNFLGVLSVPVAVNDGTENSAPFNLKVEVVQKEKLQITGQQVLNTREDSILTIRTSNLVVNDPENAFPRNFRVVISPGDNYSIDENSIRPSKNYYGGLNVPVQVTDGKRSSEKYMLSVDVLPVNDPPAIALDSTSLLFRQGELLAIASDAVVTDADDSELLQAEISFLPDEYQKGRDEFHFEDSETLNAVFDEETGILTFVGLASLADYEKALRNVHYTFATMGDTLPSTNRKTITLRVFDGKMFSEIRQRSVIMMENIELFIPTGFTPNNDDSNDTWVITPRNDTESYDDAVIRVYNKNGIMIHETKGLENSWDGRLKGDLLPADAYYYTIEFNTAFRKTRYKGIVTILH